MFQRKILVEATIVGKYLLLSDLNDPMWDGYNKAFGVSDAHREAGAMIMPSLEISESDGVYTMITSSELTDLKTNFELGKDFEERLPDGRVCKTIVIKEGNNKLIQKQSLDGKISTIVRDFSAEGITCTYSSEGVTAIRKYKRVA